MPSWLVYICTWKRGAITEASNSIKLQNQALWEVPWATAPLQLRTEMHLPPWNLAAGLQLTSRQKSCEKNFNSNLKFEQNNRGNFSQEQFWQFAAKWTAFWYNRLAITWWNSFSRLTLCKTSSSNPYGYGFRCKGECGLGSNRSEAIQTIWQKTWSIQKYQGGVGKWAFIYYHRNGREGEKDGGKLWQERCSDIGIVESKALIAAEHYEEPMRLTQHSIVTVCFLFKMIF